MIIKALAKICFFNFRVKPNKKLQVAFKDWKIVKGDTVQIRSGFDKGKVGKVIRVFRKSNSVVV